jgi:hypothetical protein
MERKNGYKKGKRNFLFLEVKGLNNMGPSEILLEEKYILFPDTLYEKLFCTFKILTKQSNKKDKYG